MEGPGVGETHLVILPSEPAIRVGREPASAPVSLSLSPPPPSNNEQGAEGLGRRCFLLGPLLATQSPLLQSGTIRPMRVNTV